MREGLAGAACSTGRRQRPLPNRIIQSFDVRTPGPDSAARSLSGGNLQKFVIGREVLQRPEVLVVNQPTWGVDAAAAASIRQALLDLAAGGTAVIAISQDLDELMEISDRFAALNEGRLSQPQPTQGLDRGRDRADAGRCAWNGGGACLNIAVRTGSIGPKMKGTRA